MRFGTGVGHGIPLPIQAENKHRPPVFFALWLICLKRGRFVSFWQDISQSFAETASAEFLGTLKEFDRVIRTKRRDEELHGAKVPVAER